MNQADHASPSGVAGRDETAPSPQDEKSEELLSVRDVVELLRDFLRARALTESEISHEVCTLQ